MQLAPLVMLEIRDQTRRGLNAVSEDDDGRSLSSLTSGT